MAAFGACSMSRPEQNFDDTIFLVAEFLVHFRRIFQTGWMCHDEARVDLPLDDFFEERFGIGLHVGLPHFESQTLVHRGPNRNLVTRADVYAPGIEIVPALRQHMIAWRRT